MIAALVKRVDYLLLLLLLLLLSSSSSSSFDWQSSLADNWYYQSFEGKCRTNGCQSRCEFPDLRDLFSQVYSRKNAYCLEYSRNIYHKTYSEYFGAVIRLFLLSQLQDLQYCSDREPVSQPVSPSVYPFHLLIVLSYKQKLKKGFNYRIRRCKFYPLLKLVSVSCSFFFFSISKSSIPWIMPLEFYHSFCIV